RVSPCSPLAPPSLTEAHWCACELPSIVRDLAETSRSKQVSGAIAAPVGRVANGYSRALSCRSLARRFLLSFVAAPGSGPIWSQSHFSNKAACRLRLDRFCFY